MSLWGILWRSENKLEGKLRYLMWEDSIPVLFPKRREARDYIENVYGYIRNRPDLKAEPHGWKMPVAVKVKIEVCK